MKKVKLNDIRIDGNTQGRSVIDQQTVYGYLEAMKEGDEFPPLDTVFDGATHWLVDGFHRYHSYKLLGIKEVSITYTPGTLEEAQVASFGVNGKHGKPRTNEDKQRIVESALIHPLTMNKTNYEIAKICGVSQPFVAAVRDPVKKQKQVDQRKKTAAKSQEPSDVNTNPISIAEPAPTAEGSSPSGIDAGWAPDEDELRANELALQADQDAMYKLLESDEPLATAHEEIKRLNHLNGQLEVRLHGLMNERNECVKMIKKLQKELDKIKKGK